MGKMIVTEEGSMYRLHPRLKNDTFPVASLDLCEVRLMNDQRFAWLILIPQREAIEEVHQLPLADQHRLIEESGRVAALLERLYRADKINIGALGNLVPQLHWHVIARHHDDPCWPGPVWGCAQALPYAPADRAHRSRELQQALG